MYRALIAFLIVTSAVTVMAQQDTHFNRFPLQLSLLPQAQMMKDSVAIHGLKINFGVGYNYHVRGLDLGVFGGAKDTKGVQINIGNHVDGDAVGIRAGAVNMATNAIGLTIGAGNFDLGLAKGLTIGAANMSDEVCGVQIGVFNYCRRMVGAQLGLINIIKDKNIRFMPFLNVNW